MTTPIDRRSLLLGLSGAVAGLFAGLRPAAGQMLPTMTMYKDPGCDCCQEWANHVTVHGYRVTVVKADMGPVKVRYQIPNELQSCHTALIGGYVVEGHVPASDVARLLKEKPQGIVGLTIPGMPPSAPGMDLMPFQPYTVLAFDAKGRTTVFAKHVKPG